MTAKSMRKMTELAVIPRTKAVGAGANRKYQAHVAPAEVLSGRALKQRLAECGFDGNVIKAGQALEAIEGFVVEELAAGRRLDFGLISFYPKLSGGLSAVDADPAADGLSVEGAVRALPALRDAIRKRVTGVNAVSKSSIRIFNVFDAETEKFDRIRVGRPVHVVGHDIEVSPDRADEGYHLEKRDGRWKHKPKFIASADVLTSEAGSADIVFRMPITPGKYTLVITTRSGASVDHEIKRIGHPVTVVEG